MPDSTNGQKGEASRSVSGVLKESIAASIFVLFFLFLESLVAISRRWGSITRAQGVSDQTKRGTMKENSPKYRKANLELNNSKLC